MKRLVSFLSLQLLLLRVRLLPRFMVLTVLLAAAIPPLVANPDRSTGFQVLADTMGLLVTTLLLLATVLAAVSLSGDFGSGALRSVLVRPIGRETIIAGQAISLAAFTAALYSLGAVTAFLIVDWRLGYSDVEYAGYAIQSLTRDNMLGYTWQLLLLPLPALICAPWLGLAISSLVEDVALCVVLSLACVMGPYLFGSLIEPLPDWIFTEQGTWPIHVLRELSRGSETEIRTLERGTAAMRATFVPLSWSAVALTAALLSFRLRDLKT